MERPQAIRTLAPQGPPAGIYDTSYTPEVAAAICRRLLAGESLRAICREDARMPTERTVWKWARAHREFAVMKRHALETARARALAAQASRDAARRAAKAGARAARGWRPGGGRASGYDQEVAAMICAQLMEGESLEEICREPAMPSVATVYNWLRRRPAFLEDYRFARKVARDVLLARANDEAPWAGSLAASMRGLKRRMKAARRRAAQISGARLAAPRGPAAVRIKAREPDGSERVIYEAGDWEGGA
jgi:hypothetical protein